MLQQQSIQEIKYIQAQPFGHAQTIEFTYTKEMSDDRDKPVSTTFHKTVEIVSLGENEGINKYCFTCLEANFSNIRQPDASRGLQLLILEVFDLLVVSTDKTGALIKIHNFSYLQEVWKALHVEILQDHNDEKYLQRISEMDQLMLHHQSIVEYLSLPSNYGLYFNGYKNFNLKEPIQQTSITYGEELSNTRIEENLNVHVTETEIQKLVTFQIITSSIPEHTSYTGSCVYLDGQLDSCSKKIKTESFTLNYSAKWVGLKKSFLH